ncbi:unnamed protein product [Kuraishia capsulata CBS 1993]|uniref:Transcription factor spt8 beta-propeller domain-containing protein n=1 Tax=Kuraishia capsulata CBS 1993 TaxID=1382522 RepID=W6MMP2_9ASCO|nr:uncharacterized protein KUCA_T00002198001 [Kuraishia capsulata CBS 1993]CDK26227.1 unnamed protein product [Kuraishia capsulata CBS 1993]
MDTDDLFNNDDVDMIEEEEDEEEEEEEEETVQQLEEMDEVEEEEDEEEEDRQDEEDEEEEEEEDQMDQDEDEDEDEEGIKSASAKKTKSNQSSASEISEDKSVRSEILRKAKNANSYDFNPFVAILQATNIHTLALTKGLKWLYTGGEDGFIRRYDFISTIERKLPLTVAQKHSLQDTITSAGIISSYWENEQPIKKSELKPNEATYDPRLSPVYALAVQSESLWCLSGLASGGITLQSVRYNEGSILHYFEPTDRKHAKLHDPTSLKQHYEAISILKLNKDETKFLSGSWDCNVLQWDLNTGKVVNGFYGSTGQISSMEFRPVGGCNIPSSGGEDDLDSLFGDSDEEDGDKSTKASKSPRSPKETPTESNDQLTKMKEEIRETQTSNYEEAIVTSDNVFLTSAIDGSIDIWDDRIANRSNKVLKISIPKGTPPWTSSTSWSNDGNSIFSGRRNATVEEFDLRKIDMTNIEAVKTLKFPQASGSVSVVRPMPNGKHLLCASVDNIRLYDLRLYDSYTSSASSGKGGKVPFMIIPGHHGGTLSQLLIDPSCRFLVSASGNRGWNGYSTEMALVYEIDVKD